MTDLAREHMRARPAIRPWHIVGARSRDPYGRKMYLYVQAAPVFEEHGYKGATVKALAHACHLSPSSLYHYFGSKREMATYPLTAQPLTWDNTYVDPDMDPLVQLYEMLGMATAMFPIWALALRLHEEIEGRLDDRTRRAGFRQGEAVFGRLIAAAAPDMSRGEAEGLARDLLASLTGTAFAGLDDDVTAAQRARMAAVLRGGVVPVHIDAEHFDGVMAGSPRGEQAPSD